MEIDFANSLPLTIKCSIEPCLPIINSLTRHTNVRIFQIIHFLLEKPTLSTLLFTITLALFTPIVTFIFAMFIGTLSTIFILCILEGLFIAFTLIMMSSFLSCILFIVIVVYIISSKKICIGN